MPEVIQKTNITCVKDIINWVLVSSPLSLIRDSFWIAAQKPAF
ncbi:MAG: hypothetical protein Q8N49_01305 [Candidatus Omnitrophota bacterium]|nr:hypothetical protein [Candidatus Omnitrophota bacterium]